MSLSSICWAVDCTLQCERCSVNMFGASHGRTRKLFSLQSSNSKYTCSISQIGDAAFLWSGLENGVIQAWQVNSGLLVTVCEIVLARKQVTCMRFQSYFKGIRAEHG